MKKKIKRTSSHR